MSGHDSSERVRSVYLHAPFCARRCAYCDFAVTVDPSGSPDTWRGALEAELQAIEREGDFPLADRLSTVYVGGGTPSLLGPRAMDAVRRLFGSERLSASELEWTAEANPESLTREVAEAWRASGVNRLSLGVQTFHGPALRWMGRLHGPDGAVEAVRVAKQAGFTNLSVDLIFGLPASVGRSWEYDLERALDLDVPHVSLYGLSVEPGTPLGRAVADGRQSPQDDERYRREFLHAAERLSRAGYEHYEVSNFARPGYESRHNAVYWEGRPYLGLGNGAHSYRHPLRRWNVRSWDAYRSRVVAGGTAEVGRELLDEGAEALERIWLGLRTRSGLSRAVLSAQARRLTAAWAKEGLAEVTEERVRLTSEGWLELDRLAVDLDVSGSARPYFGLNP